MTLSWLKVRPVEWREISQFNDMAQMWEQTPGSDCEVFPYSNDLKYLGGGFKKFYFSPLPEEMIQFDYIILLKWVETTN